MSEERKKALQYLKTCRGQIDGIIKMIEEGRYCIDISNQIMASQALLKKSNKFILEGHMRHCVKDAVMSNNIDDKEQKMKELINVLDKLIDK